MNDISTPTADMESDSYNSPFEIILAAGMAGLSLGAFMLEGYLFLHPRKGMFIFKYFNIHQLAQDHMGIVQFQHFIGFIWGMIQLCYRTCLSKHDSIPADLNPDIVGSGVRFSVVGPSVGLVFSSFLGYFHVFDSGAKELATVQVFTLSCYIVNLMFSGSKLNELELLIVMLLADSVSSSLSIALNDKQVLAARTLVYIISGAQLSMLGIMGWLLGSHSGSTVRNQICWWPANDHMHPILYRDLNFWILYTIKALRVLQGVVRSMAFTSAFNIAERKAAPKSPTSPAPASRTGNNRDTATDPVLESDRWLGIPIPRLFTAETPLKIRYSESMATTSIAAFEYIYPTIIPIVAANDLLLRTKLESGTWIEWGQMAQVGITVFGLIHFLYTIFYQLMWKRSKSFRWPRRPDKPTRKYLRLLVRAHPSSLGLPLSRPEPQSNTSELENGGPSQWLEEDEIDEKIKGS